MKTATRSKKAALAAIVLVAGALVAGRSSAEPQEPIATLPGARVATPPPAISPNSALVEDIVRLWKANLSEEFINKYFAQSDLARDLKADDVVRLRTAGVPESLIASLTRPRTGPVAIATAGAATPKTPGPSDSRRWEGLGRRNSPGLLKNRWDPGFLEFKDGSIRWVDAKDAAKNVLLQATQVTEQQLTCLKKAGGNECFEWVVKTKGEEYRFRDIAWEQGENAKVSDMFAFFSSVYPSLISSRKPVDDK